MSPGLAGSSIVWFREGFEIYLILQMAFLLIQNNKQKIALSVSTILGLLSATLMGLVAKEFVENDLQKILLDKMSPIVFNKMQLKYILR